MSIEKHKALLIATFLGLSMWLLDATLEWVEKNYYSQPKCFCDLLIFDVDHEEFIMRCVTVLAFMAFGYFIDRYIAKVVQSENKLLKSENRLRTLAAELITIQENERSRISKELHDELGQSMMLLQFQLRGVYKNINNNLLRQELGSAIEHLNESVESVRRLTKDLSPVSLENLGLATAVKYMIEEWSSSLEIESFVEIEDVDNLLSPQVQLHIYRIFQEALTNIGKHAHARHISSLMKKDDEHIYLEISDDGQGFDVKDVLATLHQSRKFGLCTMQERVRLIGGTLNLQSQRGSGAKIIVTVPIDQGGSDGPLSDFACG
jgi:signal transduction histidine kinase